MLLLINQINSSHNIIENYYERIIFDTRYKNKYHLISLTIFYIVGITVGHIFPREPIIHFPCNLLIKSSLIAQILFF